ncbi:MAG: methyltransferase domain-containing protein [Chloroflexi bacterium]|nr:methyltransferase domain-containing protein [Chloroflexota bacterium]
MTDSIHLQAGDRKEATAPGVYTLGSDAAERERLRRQSDDLLPHALALLGHSDLPPGSSAVDLGCGPSGMLELLAERVGPTGHVVGVDINPSHVAMAQEMVASRHLLNVEVVQGDARATDLPAASFDLVSARLVLVNIPDPAQVVTEMARLLRPGGWVVAEEGELCALCYPPHPAWDRLTEIFQATWRADGADFFLGRRLGELLRNAGFDGIGVEARADVYPAGSSRRTIHPDLVRSMRPKVVGRGLADEAELDELDHQVREHLADPNTLVLPYIYFLAWGRKRA